MTGAYEKEAARVTALPFDWDKLEGKRVLLSGGTGLIGSFFLDALRVRVHAYGQQIRAVSLTRSGAESDDVVEYCVQDVKRPVQIGKSCDYVLHLASNTHPKQYAADPVGTIETNILGCRNLLEIARECRARFLLASSVEIYGDGAGTPLRESDCGTLDCNTARAGYNESKRLSESLLQSYRVQYGVEGAIARFSRCFGYTPREDSKAIGQFLQKAVAGENIVLRSAGAQRYSYCYVADAVSALIKILLDGKDGEAYNVSEEDEGKTLGGYAALIASFAGKEVVFDLDENNNRGVSAAGYAILDCAKLYDLGWSPLWTVSEALFETYLKYKKRL